MSSKFANPGVSQYKAPEHKSSRKDGANMDDGDTTGVKTGLSSLEVFNSDAHFGREINEEVNALTGNTTGRIVKNPGSQSASKFGLDFEIS